MKQLEFKIIKKTILKYIISTIGFIIVHIIYWSCKKEFKITPITNEQPIIICFWHGNLLMQPFLYKKLRKKIKIYTIISEHFDGEIIATLAKLFGFGSIRGSSRKGGLKALIQSIGAINKGFDIALTPDGPKGPRFSVANGVVTIAKKSNSKIVTFSYKASSYWEINSWDRFMIPKPFSKLTFISSEPIDIINLDNESAKNYIQERLMQNAL